MTPEFRENLMNAATNEVQRDHGGRPGRDNIYAARDFAAGLLLGYQLGSPGAFGGMAQIPFGEEGGVRTLVREAIELERMAPTR